MYYALSQTYVFNEFSDSIVFNLVCKEFNKSKKKC